MASANVAVKIGSVIDSDTDDSMVTIASGVPGRLYNDGAVVVYISWVAGGVEKNNNAGENKGYIPAVSGGIVSYIDIPARIKKFTHATASDSAKLRYVSK